MFPQGRVPGLKLAALLNGVKALLRAPVAVEARSLAVEVPVGQVWKNYILAGGQRVAMREYTSTNPTGTVYFLLGDHLGSTSVVTDAATGEVVSQIRYSAYGEERYTENTTPTNYRYTGQLSRMAEIGLYHYGARWFDPEIAHFVQADTIIPNQYNSQDLHRYSYVRNNPINGNDPTGHTCLIYSNGYGSSCLLYQNGTFDEAITLANSSFGVKFSGSWNTQQKFTVLTAVNDVGTMLSNYVGGTSQGAFQITYGYIFIKMGACSECDGGGAYTHGAHSIEFHLGSPFFRPTAYRSSGLAFEMNVHTVVHELGHAFAHIGSWYDSKGALHYRPNSPYASSFPESWYLTDEGFAQGPNYTNPWMWRQHPDQGEGHEDNTTRSHEAFADMFLGFTYGVWANSDRGSARRDYMTANMAEWIP